VTCPTCHNPIIERHDDRLGCKLLACRTCRKYAAEGSDLWIDGGPGMLQQLIALRQRAVEDQRRHERMLNSPIEDPIWEQVW
jgi:hypothetical protein